MLFSFLLVLGAGCFLVQAQTVNGTNITDSQCPLNVPNISHHGDCNLLCRPAIWADFIVFYLGNYVAHAATVIIRPGRSIFASLVTVIAALLFPGSGIFHGLEAILSFAVRAPTNLQMAARAGALCAIVRSDSDNDGAELQEIARQGGLNPRPLRDREGIHLSFISRNSYILISWIPPRAYFNPRSQDTWVQPPATRLRPCRRAEYGDLRRERRP